MEQLISGVDLTTFKQQQKISVQNFEQIVMVSFDDNLSGGRKSLLKGCVDGSCTKLCQLGVADCSKSVPYVNMVIFYSKKNIVPGFSSNMRYDCMDCSENPSEWVESRLCSYGYEIVNGDSATSVFQKQNDSSSTLYFIVASNQQMTNILGREVNFPYIVQLCEGCEQFCNDDDEDDESCNFFEDYKNNDIDPQVGVSCLDGYYFENDNCLKSQNSCLKCNQKGCLICYKGYLLKNRAHCEQCPLGCLDCNFRFDEITIEYYECEQNDGLGKYYLPNLFLTSCETCDFGCSNCEFMTYNETGYPKIFNQRYESIYKKMKIMQRSNLIHNFKWKIMQKLQHSKLLIMLLRLRWNYYS
ncbi:unnamed protein product [Paramecium sonneborni]|uniref:Uncharacterized protein n=1 Tax=Paramecium sonneborni TaxID=65129 RepID=A0A8S1RQJ3_9CILI|nr:unnamed protein product [Paramecium sonneborni]